MRSGTLRLYVQTAGALALAFSACIHGQTGTAAATGSSSAQPKRLTCSVRTAPLTPGEIAFVQHDLPKAESLLREESKAADSSGPRTHNQLVRVLLAQEKFDQAQQEASTWLEAEPRSGWARISFAEVQWRRGLISEALETLQAASQLDPCNPRVSMTFGQILQFSGMYASAKAQFDRAHRLDPIDDDIESDWLRFQPRSVQLDSVKAYLARADFLPEKDRNSLERWRDTLSQPPSPDRCHLANTVSSTRIPYTGLQNGPNAPVIWGLTVSFNGKQRRLEIDTGAHGLLLTRSAANALHLDVQDHVQARGIGDEGDVSSHISRVSSIRIGDLEFQNCAVEILEKNPRGMQDVDGLIGGDVFSDFLLTLDFPGRMLRLDPLPPLPNASAEEKTVSLETGESTTEHVPRDRYIDPSMQSWSKAFRSHHDLILPTRLNNGPTRLFIMDTGSQINLVSGQMAKPFAKVSKGSNIELMGISGEVKQTFTTGPLTLSFANMNQPTSGLVGLDTTSLGRDVGVDIAGLLGAPTLHQLTVQIDYRDNLVNFTYDPKRLTRCAETITGFRMADCY